MGEKDYYAPGTYNDPNAPWNLEDLTETDAFADKKQELIKERLYDLHGWLLESFTESEDWFLMGLAVMINMPTDTTCDQMLGMKVREQVLKYVTPPDDEVIEELNQEGE